MVNPTVTEIQNKRPAVQASCAIRVQRIIQLVNMQNIEVMPFEVLLEPPPYCKNLTAIKKSDTPTNSFEMPFIE